MVRPPSRRLFTTAAFATTVVLAPACDKQSDGSHPGGLGIDGASGNVMADDTAAVDGTNLDLVARRGVLLGWEEYLFQVGFQEGMSRIGSSAYAGLLPIASIDEGFNSGQITIYRWLKSDVPDDGALQGATGHKWLVIPMLLRPDKVLENEMFDQPVEEKTDEQRKIDAILLATRAANEQYEGGRWHPHAFPETGKNEKGKFRYQTRVYLMATAPGSPDVEVLVEDGRRSAAEKVVEMTVHHQAPLDGAIVSELEQPGAMTVARVIMQRRMGERVPVKTAAGATWTVHAETGVLLRGDDG